MNICSLNFYSEKLAYTYNIQYEEDLFVFLIFFYSRVSLSGFVQFNIYIFVLRHFLLFYYYYFIKFQSNNNKKLM